MGDDQPSTRTVMVFIDGQNLRFACIRLFRAPHCHPHLLAQALAEPHDTTAVACRYYSGRPNQDLDPSGARQTDRRLDVMRNTGVEVVTRPLRYDWTWGHRARLPRPREGADPVTVTLAPYRRPQEKGIDSAIALDTVELALLGAYDVGIVVSLDRDLYEIPATVRRLAHLLPKPVRLEAAVPVKAGRVKTIKGFAYTTMITPTMFAKVRDDTWYADPSPHWRAPFPPLPYLPQLYEPLVRT